MVSQPTIQIPGAEDDAVEEALFFEKTGCQFESYLLMIFLYTE